MGRRAAAALLGVALRTLHRYLQRYREGGPEGFLEAAIVEAKRAGPHRSARKLRASSGYRSRGRLSGGSSCGPGSIDSASPR